MMKQYNIRSTCTRWFETTATHWISRRLSTCFSTIESGAREQSKVSETDGVPNLGGEHIGKDGEIIPKGMRYVSKEFYNTMRSGKIKIDDLLLVKDGATIGKIVCVKKMPYPDCSINEHVYILRTENNVCSQYIYYLFRSIPIQDQIWLNVRGSAQPGLTQQFLKSIAIYLPLIEEQNRIARYLDYKNHLINKYIRIKKKQIELLKELKQVVINDAVTGKIDVRTGKTYPKYKDSGIDWMGMIPEEWEVNRLKRISSIRYGLGQPPKEKETGLPLIRATNVKSGNIVANDLLLVDSADVPLSRDAFLKKDEIIVVRSGALTGDSAIIPDKYVGAVAGYDMVVSVYESCPQFIAYVLLSNYLLQDQLYLLKSRAAQPHLNSGELGGLLILTPTTEIQHIIVTYIDQLLKKIDHHIQTINAEISLILEFRTTLISDVVTGKLDVRSIEIPDFEEEPEDIEDGIIDDILEEVGDAD